MAVFTSIVFFRGMKTVAVKIILVPRASNPFSQRKKAANPKIKLFDRYQATPHDIYKDRVALGTRMR